MVTKRSFNELRRNRYLQYWDALESDGISSSLQYLARVADQSFDPELTDPRQTLSEEGVSFPIPEPLKQNRHWLSRFYPYNDQDIALVLQDPRIDLNKEENGDVVHNEHLRLSKTPVIPSAMADVSANYYADWLAGRGDSPNKFDNYLLSTLDEHTQRISVENRERYYGIVSDDNELGDDYERDVDTGGGVWEDIYVTNTHLIAEWDSQTSLVDDSKEEKLHQAVQTELDALSPELIFYAGAAAWRDFYGPEVELSTENGVQPSRKITDVHGSLYQSQDRFIIPIGHPANRESWGELQSRLEQSVSLAAERVGL